jgi:hypothetical protein
VSGGTVDPTRTARCTPRLVTALVWLAATLVGLAARPAPAAADGPGSCPPGTLFASVPGGSWPVPGYPAPGTAGDASEHTMVASAIQIRLWASAHGAPPLNVSAVALDPRLRIVSVQVRIWRRNGEDTGWTSRGSTVATDEVPANSKTLSIAASGTRGVRWVGVCYGTSRPRSTDRPGTIWLQDRTVCPGTRSVGAVIANLGGGQAVNVFVARVGERFGVPAVAVPTNPGGYGHLSLTVPREPGSYAVLAVASPGGRWAGGLFDVDERACPRPAP